LAWCSTVFTSSSNRAVDSSDETSSASSRDQRVELARFLVVVIRERAGLFELAQDGIDLIPGRARPRGPGSAPSPRDHNRALRRALDRRASARFDQWRRVPVITAPPSLAIGVHLVDIKLGDLVAGPSPALARHWACVWSTANTATSPRDRRSAVLVAGLLLVDLDPATSRGARSLLQADFAFVDRRGQPPLRARPPSCSCSTSSKQHAV
jgi:hypothetical protein